MNPTYDHFLWGVDALACLYVVHLVRITRPHHDGVGEHTILAHCDAHPILLAGEVAVARKGGVAAYRDAHVVAIEPEGAVPPHVAIIAELYRVVVAYDADERLLQSGTLSDYQLIALSSV